MSLSGYSFGEILESLRVYKGLSVSELADGICSDEELVSFEREEKYPTLDQLYAIAERLKVEINYFFDIASTGTFNYAIAVTELVKKYKRERDYQAIFNIIQKEKDNPIFRHSYFKQYLLWHEGICIYYLHQERKKSLELLNESINMSNPSRTLLTEREIEILTSMAIIEKDSGELESAVNLFREALGNLENLPHLMDSRIRLRILYGLSQALSKLNKFEESLLYSNQGINNCIHDEVMYLFGELHYQSGLNYVNLGELENGREYLANSKFIFKLQKNNKFIKLVEYEMEKLFKNC
ncbi:helix-turn-helix domain-containing protein [Mesobacillus harenae]|uniref:helix-turn-helix domain-containing protein n=1 Tax=Mesobacillus harenae TaxID=2213203 RepID=UPI00157FFA1E|nr:helix-turn-helix transcriptional regulator [Mesobacillus harenae]